MNETAYRELVEAMRADVASELSETACSPEERTLELGERVRCLDCRKPRNLDPQRGGCRCIGGA